MTVYRYDAESEIYGWIARAMYLAISGANVGIDPDCGIEKHYCFGIRAHDLHDTVEVVALGLPFKDAAHQDVIILRRRVNFSNKVSY